MTFYLCMMDIHTRLTSGRGKRAALKPCHPKATFEGWQAGMERCEEEKLSVLTSDTKVIFNVHRTKTAHPHGIEKKTSQNYI